MSYRIPFNSPFIVGKELYYIAQAVLGGHISGDGPFSRRCQELLEERFGARRVLLTTSCTGALEMAAMLCGLEPGDEVILPSYTFVSTANAFFQQGARLRFVDIRADTLNLDDSLVADAVGERTRAIVPVHYAGVACEMDALRRIAERHGLFVIEDAAQGVDARYRGAALGTLGDLGTWSFHETKNAICGEGGALVVNREEWIARAEILREKGTDRCRFFRGEVDKYTWVDRGSSYVPSDLLAAFLFAQLENLDAITERRRRIHDRYRAALAPLADRGCLELPVVPEHCATNHHLFHVLVGDADQRRRLIDHLRERGILAVFHYVPLHTSPMGERLGYRPGMLPVTERRAGQLLRLPLFWALAERDQDEVVREIYRFFRVDPPGD